MRNPPAGEETAGGVRRFQASPRQGNQQEEVFALGPGNPLYVFAGPMLLSRAWELPVGEGWAFEPKWDGFRCLAHLDGDTRLHSRRGTDLTPSLPELRNLHDRVPTPVVLDAELVAVRSGKPSFDDLRRRVFSRRRPEADVTVMLVAFDLLVLGGRDVTGLAYERRGRRATMVPRRSTLACYHRSPRYRRRAAPNEGHQASEVSSKSSGRSQWVEVSVARWSARRRTATGAATWWSTGTSIRGRVP